MPKNPQNSWVGTTVQPQYQTYRTAGMLQPAAPPQQPPAPPPVTPAPPPITPPAPPTQDQGGGGVVIPPFPPAPGSGPTTPPTDADRARLVDAMVSTGTRFWKTGEI